MSFRQHGPRGSSLDRPQPKASFGSGDTVLESSLSLDDDEVYETSMETGRPGAAAPIGESEAEDDDPVQLTQILTTKCVIVYAGTRDMMGTSYRSILEHSLTMAQFMMAQFHLPRLVAEYEAVIVRSVL